MKRLLDQWERKNSKAKGQQTVDDWEREIADDEVMRDASPPPAPPSQPVVSDDSVELPAPLSGQVEALETVGICMLVEYMLRPPARRSPNNCGRSGQMPRQRSPCPPRTRRCSTTSCFGCSRRVFYLCGNQPSKSWLGDVAARNDGRVIVRNVGVAPDTRG